MSNAELARLTTWLYWRADQLAIKGVPICKSQMWYFLIEEMCKENRKPVKTRWKVEERK